jgi:hypothetical protein
MTRAALPVRRRSRHRRPRPRKYAAPASSCRFPHSRTDERPAALRPLASDRQPSARHLVGVTIAWAVSIGAASIRPAAFKFKALFKNADDKGSSLLPESARERTCSVITEKGQSSSLQTCRRAKCFVAWQRGITQFYCGRSPDQASQLQKTDHFDERKWKNCQSDRQPKDHPR